MNPATSLLLDLLRMLAAGGVLLVHAGTTQFAPGWVIDPDAGHRCVAIFFVLSGYVIAHAAFSRKQTAADYAIARLARRKPLAAFLKHRWNLRIGKTRVVNVSP